MLRLMTRPLLDELWRHCVPRASAAAERQLVLLSFNRASPPVSNHRATVLVRPITSGTSPRTDVPQPKTEKDVAQPKTEKDVPQPKTEQAGEKEKIDLDIWKTIMSPLTAGQRKHGEEGPEGGDVGPGGHKEGDGKEEGPSQDTMRELVTSWRQAGRKVPEHMTDEQVQQLWECPTKTSKKKYLKFLATNEGHKKANKEKAARKKEFRMERMAERGDTGDEDKEKTLANTFLLQYWDRSMDKLLGWRNAQYMTFGQPLVFDMSYAEHMTRRDLVSAISQLLYADAENRRAVEPFHVHYCNLQPGGVYERELIRRYGAEPWERLLITATERSYVDVLPRERLVYLTADSPNVLHTFDHDKIYIVGGLVDRSIQRGVSFGNAKRLSLATARLPLDNYLHWEIGAKNLTLNQMMSILLTAKETGSWEKALDFVPTRKHAGFHKECPQKRSYTQMRELRGSTSFRFNSEDRDVDGGVTDRSVGNKGLASKQGHDGERPPRFEDRRGDETFRGGNGRFSNSRPDSQLWGKDMERSRDRMTGLTGGMNTERGKDRTPGLTGGMNTERGKDRTTGLTGGMNTERSKDRTTGLTGGMNTERGKDRTPGLTSGMNTERGKDRTTGLTGAVNTERSRDRTTGFTGGKVRTSLKSKMKNMTGTDKKPWWEGR